MCMSAEQKKKQVITEIITIEQKQNENRKINKCRISAAFRINNTSLENL